MSVLHQRALRLSFGAKHGLRLTGEAVELMEEQLEAVVQQASELAAAEAHRAGQRTVGAGIMRRAMQEAVRNAQ